MGLLERTIASLRAAGMSGATINISREPWSNVIMDFTLGERECRIQFEPDELVYRPEQCFLLVNEVIDQMKRGGVDMEAVVSQRRNEVLDKLGGKPADPPTK